MDLIYSKRANSFVNLPNDVIANKCYNMLELKRDVFEITNYEIEFDEYATLPNGHVIERVLDTSDNSNSICRLDSSEITLPLIVRTRRLGDKMAVKGMDGTNKINEIIVCNSTKTKKIKDIFIDSKINLTERDSWPIVVDSKGKVVWIPGVKKSKFDKKKIDSYDIILKYS